MTEAGDRADEDSVWATECIDDLYQGAGLQWDGFSELLKTVFGLPFAPVHGQVEVAAGGQEKSPPPCWGEVSSGAVTSLVFGVAHAV